MFTKYVSNVPLGTGTNYILNFGEPRRVRARAYLRVELPGDFNWRIFYINSVNSTFAGGAAAYRNLSGGSFRILSAKLADGGELSRVFDAVPPELTDAVALTFDGEASREVAPDEKICSDPVRLNIPDGHYLAFEWELEGDSIPCTPDSRALTYVDKGEGFKTVDSQNCPLPAMFACDRPYGKRIAFLGDSITQGCGTRRNEYEMWAGRIAAMLPEYAVWNLGLGWGRGDDAATDGSWLYKAKQNDIVIMTLGVNDILHGAYGAGRSSSAGEVIEAIENIICKLKAAGVEVILSTVPPFDLTPEQKREWRAVNLAIPRVAAMHGCRVYDIEASLDESLTLGDKFKFGAHPDGNGGAAAAEQFRRTFRSDNGWTL